MSFSNDRKGMDLEGGKSGNELGKTEERETIIRMCCMNIESIFNKRKKLKT